MCLKEASSYRTICPIHKTILPIPHLAKNTPGRKPGGALLGVCLKFYLLLKYVSASSP